MIILVPSGDGIPNYLDLDSDNDGVLDLYESGIPSALVAHLDKDGDGVIDASIPVGLNGLADTLETYPDSGIIRYSLADSDGDGTPDYLDVTSNGSDFDLYAIGRMDLDDYGGGFISPGVDKDKDGIMDNIDNAVTQRGSPFSSTYLTYTFAMPVTLPVGDLYNSCGRIYPLNMRDIDLKCSQMNNNVILQWIDNNTEIENYTIYHSKDGINYINMINVSKETHTYQTILFPSINYFKIQANKIDGTSIESNICKLDNKYINNINAYPIPAQDKITIQNLIPNSKILVYNILGELVLSAFSDQSILEIHCNDWLPGNYVAIIEDEHGFHQMINIIIN